TGPIVAHVRPEMRLGDLGHDLGNRTIIAATHALARAAAVHAAGRLPRVAQEGAGRVYYRKDFTADAVRRAQENFRTGMIEEYLADRARRDAALSLVALPAE
ncbi:MAG: hypothetical protein H0T71_04445, partial [Acidobacteria bacterium]|nr:hypothetical protein [Acidobacteriota bacterium]